ncbi:vWA domain-containing protein [Phosphitispora sp. TUW77]|uniref:vWA domain-containing protein n=1 Tax=Phosphitispora sp. TUW77 TaxID=3152361 RepID=UPI003AB67DCC
MQFLAPAAWGFFLIIPVIVLFYLLRQKKTAYEISSILLWQRVLADTMSQTPWQRLRRNLLMFLQLLLAFLLVLALMRPYLVRIQQNSEDLMILLDTSASMSALENGSTRIDLAKEEITALVKSRKPGTRFSLITVGRTPQALVTRTKDPGEFLTVLKKTAPGYYEAEMETTLSLVTALLEKGTGTQTVFFSDGGISVPEGSVGIPGFEYRKIGSSDANLAISAFSTGEGDRGLLAMTRIDNYGHEEMETAVILLSENGVFDIKAVKVAPGKAAHVYWDIPQGLPYIEARIDAKDVLEADNFSWIVPYKDKLVKTLLVTEGNIFLEQALKLNSGVELHKAVSADYPEIQKDAYALSVFDGFWPEPSPSGNYVVFNPPADSGLVKSGAMPAVGELEMLEHPVLRYVSWNDVHIEKSKGLKTSGGWEPVLKIGARALVTVRNSGNSRAAAIGFDLHRSDLPLRPAFPILMQNIFDWTAYRGAVREVQVSAETPVQLNIAPRSEEVFVVYPNGTRKKLKPPYMLNSGDTRKPGIYKVEQITGGEKQVDYMAVSFVSPRESSVAAVDTIKLGNIDVKTNEVTRVNLEVWPFIVIAVLVFLCLEWWVYLRGH